MKLTEEQLNNDNVFDVHELIAAVLARPELAEAYGYGTVGTPERPASLHDVATIALGGLTKLLAEVDALREANDRLRDTVRKREVETLEACQELDEARAEVAPLRTENEQLQTKWCDLLARCEAFADTVKRAAESAQKTGGMQVPYHDDFAHVPPSTRRELAWWARHLTEAK